MQVFGVISKIGQNQSWAITAPFFPFYQNKKKLVPFLTTFVLYFSAYDEFVEKKITSKTPTKIWFYSHALNKKTHHI